MSRFPVNVRRLALLVIGLTTLSALTRQAPAAGGTFPLSVAPVNGPNTYWTTAQADAFAPVMEIDIGGTDPSLYDRIVVYGIADIRKGRMVLNFIDGFAPHAGDTFSFFSADFIRDGGFPFMEMTGLAPGFFWDVQWTASSVTLVALNDAVAVPEAGTLGLLALGITLLLRRRAA